MADTAHDSVHEEGGVVRKRDPPVRERAQKQARYQPQGGIHQPQYGDITQMASDAVHNRRGRRGDELPPAMRTEAHRTLQVGAATIAKHVSPRSEEHTSELQSLRH